MLYTKEQVEKIAAQTVATHRRGYEVNLQAAIARAIEENTPKTTRTRTMEYPAFVRFASHIGISVVITWENGKFVARWPSTRAWSFAYTTLAEVVLGWPQLREDAAVLLELDALTRAGSTKSVQTESVPVAAPETSAVRMGSCVIVRSADGETIDLWGMIDNAPDFANIETILKRVRRDFPNRFSGAKKISIEISNDRGI